MVEATKKAVVWLSAVGGSWAFVSNPFGLFDGATDRWPAIAAWLPVVGWCGMCVAVAFGVAWSWQAMRPLQRLHDYRHRERIAVLADLRDARKNFSSKPGWKPGASRLAKGHVILSDLIARGVLDARTKMDLPPEIAPYLARVELVVQRKGVKYAQEHCSELFEGPA